MEPGTPGEIRTPNPLIRSQMLYPIELRVRLLAVKKYTGVVPRARLDPLPGYCRSLHRSLH